MKEFSLLEDLSRNGDIPRSSRLAVVSKQDAAQLAQLRRAAGSRDRRGVYRSQSRPQTHGQVQSPAQDSVHAGNPTPEAGPFGCALAVLGAQPDRKEMRSASPLERGGADTSAILRQVLARLWRRSTEGGSDELVPPIEEDIVIVGFARSTCVNTATPTRRGSVRGFGS